MMKTIATITSLTFTMLLVASQAYATIWRVNNRGFGAHFETLVAAHASNRVLPGDTIYLEGSPDTYSGPTATKKLVIIGSGYFLDETPGSSVSLDSPQIRGIWFESGANGSQLIGVQVVSSNGLNIRASNVEIKRCIVDSHIFITTGISNIRITQNLLGLRGNINSSVITDHVSGFATGVVFNNNIVVSPLTIREGYTFAEVRNNTFDVPTLSNRSPLRLNATVFQNNLIMNPNATVSINAAGNQNGIRNNAVGSANQLAGTSSQIVVADIPRLFVDASTTNSDGKYQLKPGSEISGKGSDGTDIGAFGGAEGNRYAICGLGPIPVVYELQSDGVAGPEGLPVIIKARTVK